MSDRPEKKKSGLVGKILYLLIIVVLFTGAAIFLYPTAANLWNRYKNSKAISQYSEDVGGLSDDQYASLWEAAQEYNRQHTVNVIGDAFAGNSVDESASYDELLNVNGDGIMGYIVIPKINVRLAIYHGTSDEVLREGVGHMAGTSLPVGGESTHAAMAGHNGLPSAKLLTDLDQLEEGDIFYIEVLGRTLAYEVDQIKVVLPDEVSDLDIIEGRDLVTLVTCTPYGVNTHRLLVRGTRVEIPEDQAQDVEETVNRSGYEIYILAGGAAVFVLLLVIVLVRTFRNK